MVHQTAVERAPGRFGARLAAARAQVLAFIGQLWWLLAPLVLVLVWWGAGDMSVFVSGD